MRSQELKGHLDLLLLSAVAAGPAHGYAIVEWLRTESDGEFELPENTVYAALYRLERADLLASARSRHDGRVRRVYSLTPAGRKELAGRRGDWDRFARGVRRIIEASR